VKVAQINEMALGGPQNGLEKEKCLVFKMRDYRFDIVPLGAEQNRVHVRHGGKLLVQLVKELIEANPEFAFVFVEQSLVK
jgi:hypothetical protein